MITLTISGENQSDFLTDLQQFIGFFTRDGKIAEPAKKTSTKKEAAATNEPATTTPVTESVAASVETTDETVTLEQIRKAVQEKVQAGKRDAVKAVLTELGADNVTGLKANQYADALTKIKSL